MSDVAKFQENASLEWTPSLKVERGASIAHRKLSAAQRGVIAANILDGLVHYQPTARELSRVLNISAKRIAKAQRLTPGQRWFVAHGYVLPASHSVMKNNSEA
jgi:hypothetical protein